MGRISLEKKRSIYIIFILFAFIVSCFYARIPDRIEWGTVLFLCIMVVFDSLNEKTFSGFSYSFNTVILGLIIFSRYTVVYGFIYIFIELLFKLVGKQRKKLTQHLVLGAVSIIVVKLCNTFYNNFTNQEYAARFFTLLIMVLLSFVFRYIYTYLETGKITTKYFLEIFGPMIFEIFIIFPILSFFNQLNINLVLILYLSYYSCIGFLHRKFFEINQQKFDWFVKNIEEKFEYKVHLANLGEIKGASYPKKKMIFIDEKIDYPEQLQTLIHESIHIRIRDRYSFSKPVEEIIVTFLEGIISWYYIVTLKTEEELDY